MNFDIFENILYENIENLIQMVEKFSGNFFIVKKNYNNDFQYFSETINFLSEINFIKIEKEKIFLFFENQCSKEFIFKSTLKNENCLICIKNYLQNFKVNKDNFFKPIKYYNIRTRFLRDFLISIDLISSSAGGYKVNDENLFKKISSNKITPEDLYKLQEQQKSIGEEAEKQIVSYEINQLKKSNIDFIPEHIALKDVTAGYDIKSYRKINQKIKEIFIEVKAVSIFDFKFHLSTLEFETASQYNDKYYVYLLPVDNSQPSGFDISKLMIINNIYENIWLNKRIWQVESDGFLIKRKIFN